VRQLAGDDDEYLALCGAVGLGRLLAEGDPEAAPSLRRLAEDYRWRVREGVAMGLQRLGGDDLQRLFGLAAGWAAEPSALAQRAAVAGVCEPRLLCQPAAAVISAPPPKRRRSSQRHLPKRRRSSQRHLPKRRRVRRWTCSTR
jgi:HEAT repeat protein